MSSSPLVKQSAIIPRLNVSSRLHIGKRLPLYLVLSVIGVVMLLPLLIFYPLNPDNDTYQAMAFALDQGRGLPYLGSWDQNFPGIVFYHLAAIKLFGPTEFGFRLIDLINQLLVALLLFELAKKFVDFKIALLALPIAITLSLSSGWWNAGQRDGFALLWHLIIMLLALRHNKKAWTFYAIGVALAISTFIRPTNLIYALIILPAIIRDKRVIRSAVEVVVSFIVSFLILLTPWILKSRGLEEFYLATIQFNSDVYGRDRAPAADLFGVLKLLRYFYWPALMGLAVLLSKRNIWKVVEHQTLLVFTIVGILMIAAMGKYYIYHFEVLVPFVIVLILVLVDAIADRMQRYNVVAALALLAILYLGYPRVLLAEYIKQGADTNAVEAIKKNLASVSGFSRHHEQEVIRYLNNAGVLASTEFLLLYPGLKWRSGSPGISRFTTTYLMTMKGKRGYLPYQFGWRKELDSVLMTKRPECVVASTGPEYLFKLSHISPDSLLRLLPRFKDQLLSEYRLDSIIGGFKVYRRSNLTSVHNSQ
jgi:hypothetical protein